MINLGFLFSKITQCGTMLNGVSKPFCRSMNKGYPSGDIVTIGALNLCANINRLSAKNSSLIITSKCWSVLWISFCTAALPRLCKFHAFGKFRKLSIFSNGDPSLNNLSGVTDW